MMKKSLLIALGITLPIALFAAPSAKFTATLSSATLLPETTAGPSEILSASLKTPNKKDLLIGVSLETGLFTQTKVSSKNGVSDSSEASAKLAVVVKLDGEEVFPGVVIYDERIQSLSATLGGIIRECEDTGTFELIDPDGDGVFDCQETLDQVTGLSVPDGKLTIQCECTVDPEIIDLALKTTAAHHFNFVAKNVSPGSHVITVEVAKTTATSVELGSATATALVGKGSLTVEEVRATNAPDGIEFLE